MIRFEKFEMNIAADSVEINSKNFFAKLKTKPVFLKKHYVDLRTAPDAEIALKWLMVILANDKKATLSINERPSWCASLYKDEAEWLETTDDFRNDAKSKKNIAKCFGYGRYPSFMTYEDWRDLNF